ncbi:MAG TPA: hypothetical protein VN081_00935 [Dongiaceae bacterium]|nr:hypothetical protein [Dongiaceae bacterium]
MRKLPKEKVKPILITEMPQLVLLARNKGIKDTVEMAKWIISVSAHWRSKGFKEIIDAINKIGSVDEPKN